VARPRLRTVAAVLVAIVVVASIVAGVALSLGGDDPLSAGLSVQPPTSGSREPPPRLAGTDPVTGEPVSLGSFAGKPVVINIWASWCPGCIEEAEDLRRFAEAHPEAVVLGLDYQDTVLGAKEFYRRWRWRHPSIFDASGAKTAALGLVGLPTTIFLDADHRPVARILGATDLAGFEQGLDLALGSS
jgi:thiol-disulfide isomerase/thioredoxin